MAKVQVTRITDDLDGTEGAEPLVFEVAGREYEIDAAEQTRRKVEEARKAYEEQVAALDAKMRAEAEKLQARLERALQAMIAVARPVKARPKKTAGKALPRRVGNAATGRTRKTELDPENSKETRSLIRQWAEKNNKPIGARGRISQELRDEYYASLPGAQKAPTTRRPFVADRAALLKGSAAERRDMLEQVQKWARTVNIADGLIEGLTIKNLTEAMVDAYSAQDTETFLVLLKRAGGLVPAFEAA